MPSSADRFHTVHYRTATNALNRMLRDWASFVLLENHSYIRFLERYLKIGANLYLFVFSNTYTF